MNLNRYNPHMAQPPERHGFTLIELMVVIAIIAILASITIPVIGRAMESARRAQASTEVASLDAAIRAYYNEYSRFPHQGALKAEYTDGNADLLNVLRARDGEGNGGHVNNRRRIVFIEIPERSLTEDDNPDFIDPWGQPYNVAVDVTFQGHVNALGEEIEGRIVAAWSNGNPEDDTPRPITSWK